MDVAGATAEKISGHRPAILSALGVREADLDLLAGLTRASTGAAYITDDLTLANLSFLWRHAGSQSFSSTRRLTGSACCIAAAGRCELCRSKVALAVVEHVDHLGGDGLLPRRARVAAGGRPVRESGCQGGRCRPLPDRLTDRTAGDPQRIRSGTLRVSGPRVRRRSPDLALTSLLQQLNRDEAGAQSFVLTLRDEITQERAVPGLPLGFTFPAGIIGAPHNIRIGMSRCFSSAE